MCWRSYRGTELELMGYELVVDFWDFWRCGFGFLLLTASTHSRALKPVKIIRCWVCPAFFFLHFFSLFWRTLG